jgi:hypothetical protein
MHVWDLFFRCFRVVTDLRRFIRIIITTPYRLVVVRIGCLPVFGRFVRVTALSGLAAVRHVFTLLVPVVLVVALFRLLFIFLVHKAAFLA